MKQCSKDIGIYQGSKISYTVTLHVSVACTTIIIRGVNRCEPKQGCCKLSIVRTQADSLRVPNDTEFAEPAQQS